MVFQSPSKGSRGHLDGGQRNGEESGDLSSSFPEGLGGYLGEIERVGCVIGDDRLSLSTCKKDRYKRKFPLCKDYWKSPYLAVVETYRYKDKKGNWQEGKIYQLRRDVKAYRMEGVFLEIKANHVQLDINNLLWKYPHKSRLNLLVRVLENLHKMRILNPGSKSSFYRISHKFPIRMEWRWDIVKSMLPPKRIEKLRALARRVEESTNWTFYYHKSGAVIRLYEYPHFFRFEVIPEVELKRGTARDLLDWQKIDNILRKHIDLKFYLWPIMRSGEFVEDLDLDSEALYRLSIPVENQYSRKKWL